MNTVAIFTTLYPPAINGGGPIRSTEALVEAAPDGFKTLVLTSDHDIGESIPLNVRPNTWIAQGPAQVRYTTSSGLFPLIRGYSAVKVQHPNLLHFNSFFATKFTVLPLLLARFGYWGKPVILVAPRGEFGEGALRRSTWKKIIYIKLFRILRIDRLVIWHSTAVHETEDIRRIWGQQSKVIFRENHTLLPKEPKKPDKRPGVTARFVFLGRIVEHKGLAVILEALKSMTSEVVLDVYGPEEDVAYGKRCHEIVAGFPNHVVVNFLGQLEPGQVRETLSDYDALLMPTAGENFGHVVAEALSVSCPVVTTPFTPWTQVLSTGGGVIVDNREPRSWHSTVARLAESSMEIRLEMRIEAARAYRHWRSLPERPHIWNLALELS